MSEQRLPNSVGPYNDSVPFFCFSLTTEVKHSYDQSNNQSINQSLSWDERSMAKSDFLESSTAEQIPKKVRTLNSKKIENVLHKLSKAKIFIKVDIKVHSPFGRNKWNLMPFGITHVREIFQNYLDEAVEWFNKGERTVRR